MESWCKHFSFFAPKNYKKKNFQHLLQSDWPNSTADQSTGATSLTISEMQITWLQWMCLTWLWYKYTGTSSHWLISTDIPLGQKNTPSISVKRSLNIPQSSVNSIINKWKKYGTRVNLPVAGHPHKLSGHTRRRILREATETPITPISFISWDGRHSAYSNCCLGSAPVKALWESGKDSLWPWCRL